MDAPSPRIDTLVIGGGVIGLTTALRLLERGHKVKVRAAARTPDTTSDVAPALFFPYAHGIDDRTRAWVHASFVKFRDLCDDPASGVSTLSVVELNRPRAPSDHAWRERLPAARPASRAIPTGWTSSLLYDSFLIDMPRYLEWLEGRILDLGGTIETGRVTSLLELLGEADLVVNCTGMGAGELVRDPSLRPLRGQLVRVANPGLSQAVLDLADPDKPPTSVIPRSDGVIIGGTLEPDREHLEVDEDAERAMLDRAVRLEPRLAGAAVLDRRVGVRPGRDAVRLEAELLEGLRVLHHYGHGGAGVTLSWGSAEEAVRMAEQIWQGRGPRARQPRASRAPARRSARRARSSNRATRS